MGARLAGHHFPGEAAAGASWWSPVLRPMGGRHGRYALIWASRGRGDSGWLEAPATFWAAVPAGWEIGQGGAGADLGRTGLQLVKSYIPAYAQVFG